MKLCQLACEVPGHEQGIDTYIRLWALKVGGLPPSLLDGDDDNEGGNEVDNNPPTAVIAPISPTMPKTVRNCDQPTPRSR